jgi:hypothetical protein
MTATPTLPELFASFTRYAWRLEARDAYDIDDERDQLADFLAGREPTPSQDDLDWQDGLRTIVASGRSIGRVRLVGQPLTDYTRFEFAAYPANIAAGEDVRILDRAKAPTAPPWSTDFWLFDDAAVAVLRYTDTGQFLGIDVHTADTTDLQPYVDVRQAAIAASTPFYDYRRSLIQLPEQRREETHPVVQ